MASTGTAHGQSVRTACPPTPRNDAPESLGFTPQPMVNWLHPLELLATAGRAMAAGLVGGLVDRREVQAALAASAPPPRPGGDQGVSDQHDYSASGDVWFDFAADTGDGFASTYTVAWLLSREALGAGGELPRGRFLVLGGDQVYPRANQQAYTDRMSGPFRAALPFVAATPPHLFAIPGNHDWYDGLASFLKLFCQGRWIGGWKTRQARSYFAIRLPHDWWLWGVDVQLDSDIDKPQLDFFKSAAERMRREATGGSPRLILCTGEPAWLWDPQANPSGRPPSPRAARAHKNLEYFTRAVIEEHDIRLALTLAGDLHHYCRYTHAPTPGVERAPNHRVTSGGGGAFTAATHQLPASLRVAGADYVRQNVFPEVAHSASAGWGILSLPWRNFPFTITVGVLYLLVSWVLQSASRALVDHPTRPLSLMETLAGLDLSWGGLWAAAGACWHAMRHSPLSIAALGAIVYGMGRFRQTAGGAWALGLVHGTAHVVSCFALIWLLAWINLGTLGLDATSGAQFLLFSAEMIAIGGSAGALLFALYLLISSRATRCHTDTLFSAQAIEDYKHFLRLHIGSDGRLTCRALGVARVPRRPRWRLNPAAANGEAWFDPTPPPEVTLLDEFEVR